MTLLTNAANPLITPTHDGSGQSTHPDVIDFLTEFNMPKWGGYRYWMIMTPLPFASDTHEDPNLLASADGQTWVVPSGITNPLHDGRTAENPGFDSDTDMVYNEETNELWVYYRYITNNRFQIHLVKVSENMATTAPLVVIEIYPYNPSMSSNLRSMTLIKESANRWHMWGLSGDETAATNVFYFFSADGISWGDATPCYNLNGVDALRAVFPSSYIWHFVAKPNYRENRVEFICQTRGTSKGLYHLQCALKTPIVFDMPVTQPLLAGSGIADTWDRNGIYRSSFVIRKDVINKQYIYDVWYCGISALNEYRIGYTSGAIGTSFRDIYLLGGLKINFGVNYKFVKRAIVSDGFNRPDSTNALGNTDTGNAWEIVSGDWGISGNAAYTSVASASTSLAVVESGVSDGELSVTISAGITNARNRLIFRYTNVDNFLYVVTTTTGYALSKRQAGSISTIGNYDITLVNGDVLKVVMRGSSIKLYINGLLGIDATNTFNTTATMHGLGIYNSTLARFDNFKVEEL